MGVVNTSGVVSVPPVLHPGMRTSGTAYYFAATVTPSTAVGTVSANAFYCSPIYLMGTVTRIGIEVTTGAAGACRLGLFNNNNGIPGSLILDAGTVDTTNIAIVEATIAALTMRNEWVWMGAVFDATPAVRIGTPSLAFMGGAGSTTASSRVMTGAFTYGVFPATAPTVSSQSSVGPAIWLRSA